MISHVKTLITRNAAMTYLVKKFKEKFEKIDMQEKKGFSFRKKFNP